MITFVSAFLDLSEDRTALRSADVYLAHFKRIADTGINIHLFLNERCSSWQNELSLYSNVYIEYIELEELASYTPAATLPSVRNVPKDTLNYLILMNAKTDFIYRAILANPFNTSSYYWIDFGIFHVIRYPDEAQAYLKELSSRSLRGLAIPGCHESRPVSYDQICWRFCGGVFAGDKESLLQFHECVSGALSKERMTWEVNLWAELECAGKIQPIWIHADHNDTILRLPDQLFSEEK